MSSIIVSLWWPIEVPKSRPLPNSFTHITACAFVENLDKLPDIDAIVRGEKVRVPKETDLQYAVAAALVGRAIRARSEGNAAEIYGHILDYAGSFAQREMGVMLVSDIHRHVGPALFSVPQFANWAKQVSDIVLHA